jgi:hypothetical protein
MLRRWIAGLTAGIISAGLLTVGAPEAAAGSKGRRNTTIGVGAAAAYSLLRGKTKQGLVLGAGTAYAYKRYRDARRAERRRARLARARSYRYRSPYGSTYYARAYRSPYGTRYHRRYRSRTAGYRSYYPGVRPQGWSRGKKRGWRGRSVPPGHYRKGRS